MFNLDFFKENSGQEPYDKKLFWTLLGDTEDLEKIPKQHREQLLFLNKNAAEFIYQYIEDLNILDTKLWQPFEHLKFQKKEIYLFKNDFSSYKKWLYQRGIPFQHWVLVLPNYNEHPMLLTWKMLLKYSTDIFALSDDLLIFDCSQNWYLFHYHEGETNFVSNFTD